MPESAVSRRTAAEYPLTVDSGNPGHAYYDPGESDFSVAKTYYVSVSLTSGDSRRFTEDAIFTVDRMPERPPRTGMGGAAEELGNRVCH